MHGELILTAQDGRGDINIAASFLEILNLMISEISHVPWRPADQTFMAGWILQEGKKGTTGCLSGDTWSRSVDRGVFSLTLHSRADPTEERASSRLCF